MIRALACFLLMACTVLAGPWHIAWAPQVPGVGVRYRIERLIPDAAPLPVAETGEASVVVDARPGDRFQVVATLFVPRKDKDFFKLEVER